MSYTDPDPRADAAAGAYYRLTVAATSLVDAVDALDDVGAGPPPSDAWPPEVRERARSLLGDSIRSLRAALDLIGPPPGSNRGHESPEIGP